MHDKVPKEGRMPWNGQDTAKSLQVQNSTGHGKNSHNLPFTVSLCIMRAGRCRGGNCARILLIIAATVSDVQNFQPLATNTPMSMLPVISHPHTLWYTARTWIPVHGRPGRTSVDLEQALFRAHRRKDTSALKYPDFP